MLNRFFVTGLPRSRTAWLAAFLTTGDAMCLHEPRDWRQLWDEESPPFPHDHVGISDSGLGFQLSRILEEFAPRTLIVERPPEEVEASLARLRTGLPRTNFVEILHKALQEVPPHPLVMRIPYHVLNDLRQMQKAYWHLLPGQPFDEGRFKRMCNQNIQADLDNVINYPAHHYAMPGVRAVQ